MDWTQLGTAAGSFILGIGVVAGFLGKWLPITKKYVGLAADAINLANIAIQAIEDKNISAEEIEDIKKAAIKLEADFKK